MKSKNNKNPFEESIEIHTKILNDMESFITKSKEALQSLSEYEETKEQSESKPNDKVIPLPFNEKTKQYEIINGILDLIRINTLGTAESNTFIEKSLLAGSLHDPHSNRLQREFDKLRIENKESIRALNEKMNSEKNGSIGTKIDHVTNMNVNSTINISSFNIFVENLLSELEHEPNIDLKTKEKIKNDLKSAKKFFSSAIDDASPYAAKFLSQTLRSMITGNPE